MRVPSAFLIDFHCQTKSRWPCGSQAIGSSHDIPETIRVSSDASDAEKKTTARVYLTIGRKRYVLLETNFHQDAHRHTQRELSNVTEQLANDLKVSWSQL